MVAMWLKARVVNIGKVAVAHGAALSDVKCPPDWPTTGRVILCLQVDTLLCG